MRDAVATSDRLRRYALEVAIAFAAAWLASLTQLYDRAEAGLRDAQMRLFSPVGRFERVTVVDVNEDSMIALEPQLGAWPYPRQIYALVAAYLERAGARAIVFDILFAEPREGDADFAGALEGQAAALASAALPNSIERTQAYHARLAALAWPMAPGVPRRPWPDITLPVAELAPGGTRTGAGVVTFLPDAADGYVRRIPLFHEMGGAVLPSLALAGLHAGAPPPSADFAAGRVRIGERAWPVTETGEAVLRFPSRLEALEIVPFHQIVLAALGRPGHEALAGRLAGRTIVIGSSAERLGDYVQTPLGRMQGVAVTAMAIELLDRGEVLAPPKAGWNALLVVIALLVPALSFHRKLGNLAVFPWVAPPVAVALVLAAASLLFLRGQQTTMLFPVLIALAAFFTDLIGRLVAMQRIRQRLAAEKLAAERASELKSQFMSHMTHELRTPMTAILGFNQRLASPALDAATRAHYIDVVDKNSRHLLELINNILDGAKLEAGQMKIARSPVAVRELAAEVVQTLVPLAESKGLALELRGAEGVPEALEVDPLRLKQVLLNLGGNAIKFTERGGVTLSLDWKDGRLSATVRDTGPGMDASQLERIFVPFQQAHERVAQRHGGTGLGLAISRNLCTLMGGSLTARSELGRGSAFVAEIQAPRAELPARPVEPEAPAAAPAAQPARPWRVLVVDDSEDLRDLVGLYLSDIGIEVSQAGDGEEALGRVLAEQPDAVLTDMEMPRLDGAGLARALRERGYAKPVVLLTAHPEGPDTERAMQAGCTAYVAKPVDAAMLKRTLQDLREPR